MPPRDDAVTAGRGFLLIAGAKVWFILASSLIALGLPRLLGDPARFGEFKVVNSFISVFNMVLIIGTIQTVSRLVSQDERRARATAYLALRVQLVIGGGIALGITLFAESIAGALFRDAALAPYLRLGAAVTLCYSLYAVFVGTLNGCKRFAQQAGLDMTFSTLKAGLIVGLVVLGYGVTGAFSGFAIAALIIVCLAAVVTQRNLPNDGVPTVPVRQFISLLLPILGSTLMINIMLQVDVLAIKGLAFGPVGANLSSPDGLARVTRLLGPLGVTPNAALIADLARESTSRLTGLFGGAKNVALLPYQATFALTFVVFPLLSRAAFEGDAQRSAGYIRQAIRFTLIAATATTVVIVACARPILTVLLGSAYGAAAPTLSLLVTATIGMATLVLAITILNAAGAERSALAVASLTVVANIGLLYGLLVSAPDLRESLIDRAALATLISTGVGLAGAAFLIVRKFGAFAPLSTVFRLALASAAVLAAAGLVPVDTLGPLLAKSAGCGLAFLAVLWALGEVTTHDKAAIGRILGRRK